MLRNAVMTSSHGHTPSYEDRYCAFIDILGFRNLLRGLRGSQDAVALRDIMRRIHAPASASTVNWSIDFRAQSISDAVAISTTPLGLLNILEAIEALAVDLLREGYFIRGALVRGNLYHDEKMVFGEALGRAYELESSIARFPRVIISKEVMDDISRKGKGLFPEEIDRFTPHTSLGALFLKALDNHGRHQAVALSRWQISRNRQTLVVQASTLDPFVVSRALGGVSHQVPTAELLGVLQGSEGNRIEPHPLPGPSYSRRADRLAMLSAKLRCSFDNDDGFICAVVRRRRALGGGRAGHMKGLNYRLINEAIATQSALPDGRPQ
jgi:hypothetical protein